MRENILTTYLTETRVPRRGFLKLMALSAAALTGVGCRSEDPESPIAAAPPTEPISPTAPAAETAVPANVVETEAPAEQIPDGYYSVTLLFDPSSTYWTEYSPTPFSEAGISLLPTQRDHDFYGFHELAERVEVLYDYQP